MLYVVHVKFVFRKLITSIFFACVFKPSMNTITKQNNLTLTEIRILYT